MTINHQHAGAFYTNAKLRGLSSATALAELAETDFRPGFEDSHFPDRVPHAPTVRRLAKPLIAKLDDEAADHAAFLTAIETDRATFANLSADARARIVELVAGADGKKHNKRAREAARDNGITVCATTIERLRSLVGGARVWP